MVDVNRILKGSSGNAWVDGELLASLKSIEAKIKGEFSDHNFCGDGATYSSFDGWSGEGTITMSKTDSKLWNKVAKAYRDGTMPDVKIITSLTDKATGESERVALKGVVFTELTLVGFKAKESIEEEFPFKFNDYEILDKIS